MNLVFQLTEKMVNVKRLSMARRVQYLSADTARSDAILEAHEMRGWSMHGISDVRSLPRSCPAQPNSQRGRGVPTSASHILQVEATRTIRATGSSLGATQALGCSRAARPLVRQGACPVALVLLLVCSAFVPVVAHAASMYAGRQGQVPALQTRTVSPVAYQCAAGSKVWIQMNPCPQIYLKDIRQDGDPSEDIEPERGSSIPLERVPVLQRPLDASELCRKLDDQKIPLKHHGGSDVYERNLAKSKYCP